MSAISQQHLLKPKEVADFLQISVRGLRRLVKDKRFPAPIRIGHRTHRWKTEIVEGYVTRAQHRLNA